MPQITIGKRTFDVADENDGTSLVIDGQSQDVDVLKLGPNRYSMILNGKSRIVEIVDNDEKEPVLKIDGQLMSLKVKNETDLLLERLGMNILGKKEVKELKDHPHLQPYLTNLSPLSRDLDAVNHQLTARYQLQTVDAADQRRFS